MKRSKAFRAAEAQVDRDRLYSPAEAVALARKTSATKFDPTVEVALRLGVDPRKADQMVRGTVNLPNGTARPPGCSSSPPAIGRRRRGRQAPTT